MMTMSQRREKLLVWIAALLLCLAFWTAVLLALVSWASTAQTQPRDAYIYNGEAVFTVQSYPWMWPPCGYATHRVYPCVRGLAMQMRPAAGWPAGGWHEVTRFGPEVGPGVNGVYVVRQMRHEKIVYRLVALVVPASDPTQEVVVPLADVAVDVRKRQ